MGRVQIYLDAGMQRIATNGELYSLRHSGEDVILKILLGNSMVHNTYE